MTIGSAIFARHTSASLAKTVGPIELQFAVWTDGLRQPRVICAIRYDTIRYDTLCCFNVRSKGDSSQLNLPRETKD